MKSYLIAFILLLTASSAYTQGNPVKDPFAAKFINYFNADKTDSLYNLFDAELKKDVTLDQIGQLTHQLKNGYGNLIKCEYIQLEKGSYGYLISFERSTKMLNLAYTNQNKIIGFFIVPNPHQQPDLPGTVTVKTPTSTLKGTLSIPDGTKKVPVVLLIAGSGPTDRDGNSDLSSKKQNSYLLLSDSLKQKGIAVLRFDKRGVGQSKTSKSQAESLFKHDVDDVIAFIKFLKADKRFSKIIIAGHSEGSLTGIMALQQEAADAFISLEGAGFPIDKVLKTQFRQGGVSGDGYKNAALIIDSVKAGLLVKQKMAPWLVGLFDPSLQPYLHSWMQYDPQKEIAKLSIPILIVQGTQDMKVSMEDARSLKKGNPKAELKQMEGMGHMLKAGSAEFEADAPAAKKGNLPLRPALITAITGFIKSLK